MNAEYYDDDYENEPYFCHVDHGLGMCSECGSFLENWGAVSQGDGDLYDEIGCPNCQEARGKANEIWLSDNDDDFLEGEFE